MLYEQYAPGYVEKLFSQIPEETVEYYIEIAKYLQELGLNYDDSLEKCRALFEAFSNDNQKDYFVFDWARQWWVDCINAAKEKNMPLAQGVQLADQLALKRDLQSLVQCAEEAGVKTQQFIQLALYYNPFVMPRLPADENGERKLIFDDKGDPDYRAQPYVGPPFCNLLALFKQGYLEWASGVSD